jgi:hypothetical protein
MSSAESSSVSIRRAGNTTLVSPVMLRHFAVLTVVITGCIAVFAEGEKGGASTAKPQGGSAVGAMLGRSEEAALKKSGGDKPTKEVNGLRLGSGTRLSNNSGSGDEGSQSQGDTGSGDVRNLDPRNAVALDANGNFVQPGYVSPPLVKDPNGVPAPAVKAGTSKQPKQAMQQRPRPATQAEYDRMMEASALRSGKASTETEAD